VKFAFQFFWIFFSLVISAQAEKPKITVGVIAAFTGPAAPYGVALQNGIQLYLEEQKSSDVRYVFESVEWDIRQAVQAYRKLVSTDHVDVVYVWGVNFGLAIAPLAAQNRLLMISQSVAKDIDKNNDYVVRFMTPSDRYMRCLLDILREKKLKKLAIVLAENSYLEELTENLHAQLAPEESLTIVDRFGPKETDFHSRISALRQKSFDALGVFLAAGQIGAFYKQLRAQGVTRAPTFGTNFFNSLTERQNAAGAMHGAFYVIDHVTPEFRARYVERFRNDDQLNFSSLSYRFAKVLQALAAEDEKPITKRRFQSATTKTLGASEFITDSFDLMRVDGTQAIVDRWLQ